MPTINDIKIPDMTVTEELEDRNKENMEIPALDYFGSQLSFKEFFNEVDNYIKAFKKLGIKKDDVVTICMPGVPEFIISFYALNKMGAVTNGVNINFLRSNLKRYTDEKKSDTLLIFDKFFPEIKEQIKDTKLKNVVFTSLFDYMPEELKQKSDDLGDMKQNGIELPKNKEFIRMNEFINVGKSDKTKVLGESYDEDRESVYLYSSGTTGEPKCVVFKDYAVNALVNMHDEIKFNDAIGDRSLLIIPPYYATSLMYAVNLQLAKGKTLVLQPIYNKETFAHELRDLKINHTVAAMSHYATLVKSDLKENDLKNLKFPGCGGEAVPYSLAKIVNEKLHACGAQEKLVIGGGTSELGSSVIVAYHTPNKVNETGDPLPGVEVKIISPESGKEVEEYERGEMIVSSPNIMSRYYGNEELTEKYFTTDKEGKRWGHPGDIAVKNTNGSYTILGRKNDSFINKDGERIYLFDTEEEISKDPAILECEAVALPKEAGDKHAQVIFAVINPQYKNGKEEIVRRMNDKIHLDGVKFIDTFGTSEITGKRDTKALLSERDDFYFIDDDGEMKKISYPYEGDPIIENIQSPDKNKTKIRKK